MYFFKFKLMSLSIVINFILG